MWWNTRRNQISSFGERTSPFKSAGASVQSNTVSRGVRISGSNAGYTMFRDSVKGTGYPLHSPVSPSLPLHRASPCAITFQLDCTATEFTVLVRTAHESGDFTLKHLMWWRNVRTYAKSLQSAKEAKLWTFLKFILTPFPWKQNTKNKTSNTREAEIFHKSRRHLKILWVKWSKVPYCGPTNVKRHCIKFICSDELAPAVCAPLSENVRYTSIDTTIYTINWNELRIHAYLRERFNP